MAGEASQYEIAPGVELTPGSMRIAFTRSSGPGGQNVNKLNTKVQLWVSVAGIRGITPAARQRLRALAGARLTDADEIHLVSDAERSQLANRRQVMQMLRELIVHARHEPRRRKKTRMPRAAKERRLEHKHHRAEIKQSRHGRPDE